MKLHHLIANIRKKENKKTHIMLTCKILMAKFYKVNKKKLIVNHHPTLFPPIQLPDLCPQKIQQKISIKIFLSSAA